MIDLHVTGCGERPGETGRKSIWIIYGKCGILVKEVVAVAEIAVSVSGLSKSYDGKTDALHELNLEIPEGGVFGFLGPNGAGKTTTVKLLNGLLKPTAGRCSVLGLAPYEKPEAVHGVCGVMTDSARLYGQMTGMENLVFFARMFDMTREDCEKRASELLRRLDLWDARDRKVREYSTGMAQRLSLARSLVGRPKVLFLDEPTSGLDPESVQTVNGMISELASSEGTTVFLCTHQLRYAQDICTGYGIICRGRLLAFGDLERLSREIGVPIRAQLRVGPEDRLEGFSKKEDFWEAAVQREEDMPLLVRRAVTDGHDVYEARLVKPTLEEIYFHYINREETAV